MIRDLAGHYAQAIRREFDTPAHLVGVSTGGALLTALMWLAGTRMNPADPADLLMTIAAEDVFDAAPSLPHITVPTPINGGARDQRVTAASSSPSGAAAGAGAS